MHRLPRQLGWSIGLLALVCSSVLDWQRAPDQDPYGILGRAAIWGGLCAVLASLVAYVVCIAMGSQEPHPSAEALVALPATQAGAAAPRGRAVGIDLTVGEARPAPSAANAEEEFPAYAPEEVAQAIRTQLGPEEARAH